MAIVGIDALRPDLVVLDEFQRFKDLLKPRPGDLAAELAQALFDYQTSIESGDFKEGEITLKPPTEAAHKAYASNLEQMRRTAASEGVPLLPNPLAGTLKRPTARSP